jgi:hypothetical protein
MGQPYPPKRVGVFSPYTSRVKGRGGKICTLDSQHNALCRSGWIPASHIATGFPEKLYIYFVIGEDKLKPVYSFPGGTVTSFTDNIFNFFYCYLIN